MVAGKALFVDMESVHPLVRVGVRRQYSKRGGIEPDSDRCYGYPHSEFPK